MSPLRRTTLALSYACGCSLLALAACPAQAAPAGAAAVQPAAATRPRVIVTTDGEQDDLASMHRFILYTNDLDVAGIVTTSSRFHHAGDAKAVPPIPQVTWLGSDWIYAIIRNYAIAYPKLKENSPTYPTPAFLASMVKVGNITDVGEYAKDTEGSNWIKKVLLDDDERPVYISVWGGTNVVAAALRSIYEDYHGKPDWQKIAERVSRKTWLLIDLDQDAAYRDYIAKQWPDVNVVMNNGQFSAFAYRWTTAVPEALKPYYEAKFNDTMIRKGPIESDYSLSNGERGGSAHDWFSEGDTPQFMQQFPVGLSDLDHYDPSYGNWGGRYVQRGPHLWIDNPAYLDLPGNRVADYSPYAGANDFPTTSITEAARAGATTIRLASVENLSPHDRVVIGFEAIAQEVELARIGTGQAPATRLAADAASGATVIQLGSVAGIGVGDPVTIGTGAAQESRIVARVGSGAIETRLAGDLAAGATTARLAATANLRPGDDLAIGSGPAAETVKVATVGNPSSDYLAASVATTLAAGATTLTDATAPGGKTLRLLSTGNFLTGQTVAIGSGGTREFGRLEAVGVGGETTLGLPSAAGSRTIKILSSANFLAETPVWIDAGAAAERAVISPKGPRYPAEGADQEGTRAAGATTLSAAGQAGVRMLKVANGSGFLVGAPISVGTGSDAEQLHVSYVGTDESGKAIIELVEPLARAHPQDTPVAASGLTFLKPLARAHPAGVTVTSSAADLAVAVRMPHAAGVEVATVVPAGSRVIKVTGTAGFEVGRTIVIDSGADRETAQIAAVGTAGLGGTGLTLSAPTKLRHAGPVMVQQAAAPAGATRIRLAHLPAPMGVGASPAPATNRRDLDGRFITDEPSFPLPAVAVGDRIVIGDGADAETVTVTGLGTGGPNGTGIAFEPALRHDHDGAISVHDDGTGVTFAAGVRGAHPAGSAAVSTGSGLTLAMPLSRGHARGSAVQGLGSGVVLTKPLPATITAGLPVRNEMNYFYPQARWTAAIQNDFAARVDWQIKGFGEANHAPVVSVERNALTLAPGSIVQLRGAARDPDGNALAYRWWQYREAGTYPGAIDLARADTANAEFKVPADAAPGQTIHVILEVQDGGAPPITRYQRVIVTVGGSGGPTTAGNS